MLKEYKRKRSFDKTPEPRGIKKKSAGSLRFVVQKHYASHLHYDFRLEMHGVLKSWAVPKGPSMNPADKRLAVLVEDHPYDYKDFEGIIPKGNYGAGRVIIWDKGTYELDDSSNLKKGHLKFILHGKKLRGEFSLIRFHSAEKNSWLLIKKKDKSAEIENNEQTLFIQNRRVKVTHLSKIFWPREGFTKGDVIAYYRKMAPVILPYLKNRFESLNRHPNGITGENFFQKNIKNAPDWALTKNVYSQGEKHNTRYLICQDEATLIYMANLGCIEIHSWLSRIQSPNMPDFCVLDLDPEDIAFSAVVKTAQAIHRLLEKIGAENYCKTSGATGLHIFIPLGAKYSAEQSMQFAELIAAAVHQQLPKITSITRSPKKRQGRVYIDFLQNRLRQTIAAPYSLRPRPAAPVSTPLQWHEVNARLNPTKFNIQTISRRLAKIGDPWQPLLQSKGINLSRCLKKLQSLVPIDTR